MGILVISVAYGAIEPSREINASIVSDTIKSGQAANFDNCIIVGDLILSGLEIEGVVHFNNTVFKNSVDFDRTTFNGYADFSGAKFRGNTYFNGATFSGDADFNGATFSEYVYFNGATLSERADYSRATFNRDAEYSGATFSEYVYFNGATFSEYVYFNVTKFNGDVYFNGAKFNWNAHLTGARFKGYLLGWNYLKNLEFDEASYLDLIANLKSHGQFDNANDCYYTYQFNNMKGNPFAILAWLTCGFGVRWHHTIGSAIIICIFFGLLYRKEHHLLIESIAFSAVALFSLPKEVFPSEEIEYKKLMDCNLTWNIPHLGNIRLCSFRILFSLERLIGWGLMILLINTISRVMIHY